MAKLYIFDKDGTLVTKRGGGDPPIPNSVEEQIPLPGVVEKCQELRKAGHTLAIASNQGGVAWGFLSYEEAWKIVTHAAKLIEADAWEMCPHHPKGTIAAYAVDCKCRKPQRAMLLLIMNRLNFNPKDTVMVGDMDTDRQAAEAAGIEFMWAKDFFNWKEANNE